MMASSDDSTIAARYDCGSDRSMSSAGRRPALELIAGTSRTLRSASSEGTISGRTRSGCKSRPATRRRPSFPYEHVFAGGIDLLEPGDPPVGQHELELHVGELPDLEPAGAPPDPRPGRLPPGNEARRARPPQQEPRIRRRGGVGRARVPPPRPPGG